jgi:DNA ligase-1
MFGASSPVRNRLLRSAASLAVVSPKQHVASPRPTSAGGHAKPSKRLSLKQQPIDAATLLRKQLKLGSSATAAAAAAAAAGASSALSQDSLASRDSLASLFPSIASGWLAATNSKLLRPSHVLPSSVKLIWWQCGACRHMFRKRVYLHVAERGACPHCHACPTRKASTQGAAPQEEQRMPIRVDAHAASPGARSPGGVAESLADRGTRHLVDDRNLQPMLAYSYDKYSRLLDPATLVAVSPKLDGIRCVVAQDSKTQRAVFFSRNGLVFDCCARIAPDVQALFSKDPGLVLDGELYNHRHFAKDFSSLTSAVKTRQAAVTAPVQRLQQHLQLHCFDVMHSSHLHHTSDYRERYAYLASLLGDPLPRAAKGSPAAAPPPPHPSASSASSESTSSDSRPSNCSVSRAGPIGLTTRPDHAAQTVQLVPMRLLRVRELDGCFRAALADGYEGVMVKLLEEPYRHGMRSTGLLKLKQMHDTEYVITGAVRGTGKWHASLGAFICQTPAGQVFSVAPSVTEDVRLRLWQQRDTLIGKALTVQYQEITAKGVPRFPIGKAVRGLASGADWV